MDAQEDFQPKDQKNRPEINFAPKNWEELKEKIIQTGLWEQEVTGNFEGEKIQWDDERVQKLYKDFGQGERTFELRTEEGKEMITSRLYIENANVRCKKGDKVYKIRSGKETVTIGVDGVETSEVRWASAGSDFNYPIGGKRLASENPEAGMRRELGEELGEQVQVQALTLTSSEVEIIKSPGYPGLETRYQVNHYDVELTEESWEPFYREEKKRKQVDDKTVVTYNRYEWEAKDGP